MYKVSSRSATNIVAKTSRGRHPQPDIKQQKLIIGNDRCENNLPENMTSPTLVFKKSPTKTQAPPAQQPQVTQNQEEMVKYVQSSWSQVMQEYESSQLQGNLKVVYYEQRSANSALKDFKPFELEEWFVKRMLQNMDLDPSITA